MACNDEDISLTEDQLLETLDDPTNGDNEFLNEVNIPIYLIHSVFLQQKNAEKRLQCKTFLFWEAISGCVCI